MTVDISKYVEEVALFSWARKQSVRNVSGLKQTASVAKDIPRFNLMKHVSLICTNKDVGIIIWRFFIVNTVPKKNSVLQKALQRLSFVHNKLGNALITRIQI